MANEDLDVGIKHTTTEKELQILEETLLVEIVDDSVGVDGFGNRKRMTMSRKAFDAQSKDVKMEILEVIKPKGYTMAQWKAKVAAESAPKTKAKDKEKEKVVVPVAAVPMSKVSPSAPTLPTAPTEDEMKAALESNAPGGN